ncbi:MAG: hypothetical protein AB1405_04420 [Bdellovibrionota bacterium]
MSGFSYWVKAFRRGMVVAWTLLLFLGPMNGKALAEGSAQLGGNQGLLDATELLVDILDPDSESIHWAGTGDITVYAVEISGGLSLVGTISPGGSLFLAGEQAGEFLLVLDTTQPPGSVWDVEVQASGVPTPGRLHSTDWRLDGGGIVLANALNGSFYALLPGGGDGLDAVVQFQLVGLAGGVYRVSANASGVDGPLAGRSVPLGGNIVSPQFPIYLAVPEKALHNFVPATASALGFTGGITGCDQLGPGETSGTFSFQSDITATAYLTCDVNGDGKFNLAGAEDFFTSFSFTASDLAPDVVFVWDGFNAQGQPVPPGTYECRVQASVGEFHYVTVDIETSYEGMRFFALDSIGGRTPLRMFWNDSLVQVNEVLMPNGEFGLETSGPDGIDSGPFGTPAVANGNARAWGNFGGSGKGDAALLDTFSFISTAASNTVTVRFVNGPDDPDGDGIPSVVEDCDIGSNPAEPDSDFDTLFDGLETSFTDPESGEVFVESPINHDSDTLIDALDPDSDDDTILDGTVFPDGQENGADTDGDGYQNFRDDEDDGDFVLSAVEFLLGTGIYSFDTDNDGISDGVETNGGLAIDTDGDSILDAFDLFTDFDSIPDATEGGADLDGDGIGNWRDPDSDGDGLLDDVEGDGDLDSDNKRNFLDIDDDGDKAPTASELFLGIDPYDSDTDDDGISDGVETDNGILVDTDGDSVIDALDLDSDDDQVLDQGEANLDTDGDKTPDFRDPDDDNDFVPTVTEVFLGTNSKSSDSDGDKIIDPIELNGGFAVDTDSDGVLDARDTDSDGDGVDDIIEKLVDTDGDGRPNFRDTDDDDDGILTLDEFQDGEDHGNDVDLDLIFNWLDLNSDGDDFPDSFEGRFDFDGDTIPDYLDPDSGGSVDDVDGDGLTNLLETALGTQPLNPDTDGDGLNDFVETRSGFFVDTDEDGDIDALDLDSDGDGLLDEDEGLVDTDGDTRFDYRDDDDDGDGISTQTEVFDAVDHGDDVDTDFLLNWHDTDADGDGPLDGAEGTGDIDGDGIPNYLDPAGGGGPLTDSDFDGIPDVVELALGLNPLDPDSDGDTLGDFAETNGGFLVNSDTDALLDAIDLDSDNDGIGDETEGLGASDGDGVPDFRDPDDDGDGVPTNIEYADGAVHGTDVDGDLILNWHDTNSDADAFQDGEEGTGDSDGDNVPNYLDPDSGTGNSNDLDGDGIPNATEDAIGTDKFLVDTDGDGIGDFVETNGGLLIDTDLDGTIDALDLDSDKDSVPDAVERGTGGPLLNTDGDAAPDFRDVDDDGDGLPTLIEVPLGTDYLLEDTDGDGIGDEIETDGGLPTNTDGDSMIDALDPDSEEDTRPDADEGAGDADLDGLLNFRDPDCNGNGVPDATESNGDLDADGIRDFCDTGGLGAQLAGKSFSCALAPSAGPIAWDAIFLYGLVPAGWFYRRRRGR